MRTEARAASGLGADGLGGELDRDVVGAGREVPDRDHGPRGSGDAGRSPRIHAELAWNGLRWPRCRRALSQADREQSAEGPVTLGACLAEAHHVDLHPEAERVLGCGTRAEGTVGLWRAGAVRLNDHGARREHLRPAAEIAWPDTVPGDRGLGDARAGRDIHLRGRNWDRHDEVLVRGVARGQGHEDRSRRRELLTVVHRQEARHVVGPRAQVQRVRPTMVRVRASGHRTRAIRVDWFARWARHSTHVGVHDPVLAGHRAGHRRSPE